MNKVYVLSALGKAKWEKRQIVQGNLIFLPKLLVAEPEPIVAISYSIEGDMIALHNSLPSVFNWKIHNRNNEEPTFEVRGQSKYNTALASI